MLASQNLRFQHYQNEGREKMLSSQFILYIYTIIYLYNSIIFQPRQDKKLKILLQKLNPSLNSYTYMTSFKTSHPFFLSHFS